MLSAPGVCVPGIEGVRACVHVHTHVCVYFISGKVTYFLIVAGISLALIFVPRKIYFPQSNSKDFNHAME